tara:strand:+ start:303 stop:485 length:183 start_codon:yes stop_codon:yes gene_type:complete
MVMSNEEAMEIVLKAAKHRASILPFQSDKRKKILAAAYQLQSRLTWQQWGSSPIGRRQTT